MIFKSLDYNPIAGAQPGQQIIQRRLIGAAQLVHDSEASSPRQYDLPGTGITMTVTVGTGLVHVHCMMGMFD
jgi:hypothetical protein